MGFLDKLKSAATQAAQASTELASSSAGGLWSRYGDTITDGIVSLATKAAATGSECIADDEKYKEYVIDAAWEMLPLPVRLIGRDRMQWDTMSYSARSQLFVIDGDAVAVHPDAKPKLERLCVRMISGPQEGAVDTPETSDRESHRPGGGPV